MRSRPALLVVCLLVTAFAAMPLSARDLRHPQPTSASWLEEMTGWVSSLWESLSGLAGGAEQRPKNLELPPPANGASEGETTPGGSCIDPNGPPSCGFSNT
jgi:hypothetical protein